MTESTAIRLAVDLLHTPARIHHARTSPLPQGVHLLLRLAVGDEEAQLLALESTGYDIDLLTDAAGFFIEQVLLSPNADAYRVLGSTPFSTAAELRRNMAYLLRWVHPDLQANKHRAIFLHRVIEAWEELKTPARRRAYDSALIAAATSTPASYARDSHGMQGTPSSKPQAQPAHGRSGLANFVRSFMSRRV
jgi:hypothetical protein